MQLDGGQIGEFKEALFNAFKNVDNFKIMLKERLDKDLSRYASTDKNFLVILFELLEEANREEWIDELIVKSKETVPKNAKLYAFAQKMGLTSSTTQQVEQLQALERRVVGSNQFLDLSIWNTTLSQIESQVCRIEFEYDQGWPDYGTGFLISPNLLMTNYHVMEAIILGEEGKTTEEGHSAKAATVKCRFDYKYLAGKTLNPGTIYKLHHNWKVDFSPNSYDSIPPEDCLDYAIIRLEGSPGEDLIASKNASIGAKRGWIKLPDLMPKDAFTPNSPLIIAQHPNAMPLKLALGTDAIIGLNENKTRVRYTTNTEPGSSGSPCFNQKLELIALHHSGDPDVTPTYNEGIPLSAITALLKKRNISLDIFEPNKPQNPIPSTEQANKPPINLIENQPTKLESATSASSIPTATPTATPTVTPASNVAFTSSAPKAEILSFRKGQGATKTMIVAFIIISGLKEVGGLESVELLTKLHSSIKSLVNSQPNLNVEILSNLLGAIVLFPNSPELDPLDTIKLVVELNKEMNGCGIPIKVGMSLGEVQELFDIDGKANFIGVCINQAARLATAKIDNHPGLLVYESLASHLQSALRAGHWLSSKNSSRSSLKALGKRDESFLCYYPPLSIWPTLPNITYQYDESFKATSKTAALIAYDLPDFSKGDLNQLSQRFRAITDVFLALVANTNLSLEYFYFSPGGDGGVMVFTDLEKQPIYNLAKDFAERLIIESENKNQWISVDSRIGLHYGSILLYKNAQGEFRPTGDDVFIADVVTSDDAAKQEKSLIFTEPFVSAASGGAATYFTDYFHPLPILNVLGREIKRYSRNKTNNGADITTKRPESASSSNAQDNALINDKSSVIPNPTPTTLGEDKPPKPDPGTNMTQHKIAKLSNLGFIKLMKSGFTRSGIAEVWFAIFDTKMDDELNNKELSDCIIELRSRASKRSLLENLYDAIVELNPDIEKKLNP